MEKTGTTINMRIHEENTPTILYEFSVVHMCGLSVSVC